MLKGAVVGVGYLGNFHAQKIKAHAEAELIGVCDYSFAQAQKVAGELGTTAFEKPEQLLGKVDFVHIAASTQAHYSLAKMFLDARIPVLVEKPIAATAAQAEEICELSEKKQVLFSVGHIERFNPAFKLLKENIVGVTYLELNRLAPFRPRGADVSVLHDLSIHDIDLVQWLFNSAIKSWKVSGQKLIQPTVDDVSIRLVLENGVQVTINNSRVTPQIIRNYRAVSPKQVLFANTATLEAEVLKPLPADPFHSVEKIQIGKQDSLALEVNHFIQAVLGKVPPAITGREALSALKYVETFVAEIEGIKI